MKAEGYFARSRCPICGAEASAAVPCVRSCPPAEEMVFSDHKVFLSGYAAKRVFFTYCRCPACRGLYCRDYFTKSQLDHLYGHLAENNAMVPLAARERTQEAYFRLLRAHCDLTGELLEIGPDIGLFAGACAREGRFEKFWLNEPNVEVHEALRKNMAGRELVLRRSAYTREDMPAGSLSVAVLIHVLDHLLDLDATLQDLRHNLKPGGVLFIVTHDESSLLARVLGRRWPPYTLQHPQLFSPRSMREALTRRGFEVVATVKTANHFSAGYLANSLLTVLGMDRPRFSVEGGTLLPVRLGNFATIARKQ